MTQVLAWFAIGLCVGATLMRGIIDIPRLPVWLWLPNTVLGVLGAVAIIYLT